MSELEALTALRDKVKDGGASGNFGPLMKPHWDFKTRVDAMRAYLGSLDAAKALHDAVLPRWTLTFLGQDPYDWTAAVFCEQFGPRRQATVPANPARAWLLAVLEALIAQEQDQ